MKRRHFLTTAAGAPLGAAQHPTDDDTAPRRRPNVLFILFDKCRRDAIGAYRLKEVRTPNMDRLADSGVLFSNCYTPQALCGPARASIITGLYPHSHGLQKNVYPTRGFYTNDLYHEPIPNPFLDSRFNLWTNFPHLLLNAGYRTAYFGKWHLGEMNPGFFNEWNAFNSGLRHWIGEPHQSEFRPDVQTEHGIEFIEQNAHRPFFLYQAYYTPHEPLDPPQKYLEQLRNKGVEPAGYYGLVQNLDWNVGRLVEALERHKILDQTFIVITTEHGRTWRERPGTQAGMGISYDEAARIPLIVRYPPLLPSKRIWNSGVSLVDLMPTILNVANVSVPRVHGRNVLADLQQGRDDWSRPVFIENVSQRAIAGSQYVERSIRTEKWKMILRRFDIRTQYAGHELYDIESDPEEKNNLFYSRVHKSTVLELVGEVMNWAEKTEDSVARELTGALRSA